MICLPEGTVYRIDCAGEKFSDARRGFCLVNFFRAAWRSIRVVGMFVVAGTELAVKQPETRQQRADWLHRFCARALQGSGKHRDSHRRNIS